jgi:hypothetical protein
MSNSNQNWNDRNKEYDNTQKQSQDRDMQPGKENTGKVKDISAKSYTDQRSQMMKKQEQDRIQNSKTQEGS